MHIQEINCFRSAVEKVHERFCCGGTEESLVASQLAPLPAYPSAFDRNAGEQLWLEVRPRQDGLTVSRIGPASPLRKLVSLCSSSLRGAIEAGDRIVAIDGVRCQRIADVDRLLEDRDFWEICVFDHRTRLTVSWRLNVKEVLAAA